eukprot:151394-Prymnesium_polylepis.1
MGCGASGNNTSLFSIRTMAGLLVTWPITCRGASSTHSRSRVSHACHVRLSFAAKCRRRGRRRPLLGIP